MNLIAVTPPISTPAQAARTGAAPAISYGGNFGLIVERERGVRQIVKCYGPCHAQILPAESLDRLSPVAIVIRRPLRSPELTARPVRLQRFGARPSSG